jgi:hypothetical protein
MRWLAPGSLTINRGAEWRLINADSIYNRYPKVWIWSEHAYAISLSDCRTISGHIMRLIEPRKREATLAITAAG